jgi:hypothetical protein
MSSNSELLPRPSPRSSLPVALIFCCSAPAAALLASNQHKFPRDRVTEENIFLMLCRLDAHHICFCFYTSS